MLHPHHDAVIFLTLVCLHCTADQGGPVAAAKVSRCYQGINRLGDLHHGQVSGDK